MSGRRSAWLHALTALLLTWVALAGGTLGAFLAAPVVLGLGLQGVACARNVRRELPRRSVGLGLLLVGFGAAALLSGRWFGGSLVVLSGLMLVRWATAASLLLEPPRAAPGLERSAGLSLRAGVAADEAVRALVEVTRAASPDWEYGGLAAEARLASDRNLEQGWLARPENAHPLPPPLEKPRLAPCRVAGCGPAERLSFASEFEPQDPEIRTEYLAFTRNRTAHAVLFRDRRAPRPMVIFVHGYGGGIPALDARLADVKGLRARGFDVALFAMPLHGARSIGLRSGAGILDSHPLWTNAALGQAVWDLRRLTGFLRAEGAPSVGVFGLSLGGYTAALFASVEEGLASVITMAAPASLENLFWREMSPSRRDAARAAGLTSHVLELAWARHAPLRLRPRVAHEGRLVIGGVADRIVLPDQVGALWEHWGQPRIHWFPGTHVLWRGASELRRAIGEHLGETLGVGR